MKCLGGEKEPETFRLDQELSPDFAIPGAMLYPLS